jgi:AAA15 family ATPase/GTPase
MTTIDCVILEGFKSFRNRTEVPLKNVTIFAGANSSGKSTTMQSLLLFKQTLESGFDPGPLLINGQNVVFSNTEQMFWSAPGDRREEMTLGLRLRENTDRIRYEVTVTRQKSASSPLQIVRTQMQKKR